MKTSSFTKNRGGNSNITSLLKCLVKDAVIKETKQRAAKEGAKRILETAAGHQAGKTIFHGFRSLIGMTGKTNVGRLVVNSVAKDAIKKPVYGAAAYNVVGNVAKKNVFVGSCLFGLELVPNIWKYGSGKISGYELCERTGSSAAGIGGGYGGAAAGMAAGTAIFPGVGTVIGGIVGSIAGGIAASSAVKSVFGIFK